MPSNLTTPLQPQFSVAKQPHYVTAIKFSVAKQPQYATASSILSCQATSLRHCILNSQLLSNLTTALQSNLQLPSNHTTPLQPQLSVTKQLHDATATKFTVAKQPHYDTATSILSCQATSLRHCNLNSRLPSNLTTSLQSNSQLPSNLTTPLQAQFSVAKQPHYATAISILSCQATSLRHCNLNSQLPSNLTTPLQ